MRGKQSQAVIRNLLEKRLLRISGRKEVVGRPFLYSTTREFLMHFGLKSLGELPPLEEFEETFGSEPVERDELDDARDPLAQRDSEEPHDRDVATDLDESPKAGRSQPVKSNREVWRNRDRREAAEDPGESRCRRPQESRRPDARRQGHRQRAHRRARREGRPGRRHDQGRRQAHSVRHLASLPAAQQAARLSDRGRGRQGPPDGHAARAAAVAQGPDPRWPPRLSDRGAPAAHRRRRVRAAHLASALRLPQDLRGQGEGHTRRGRARPPAQGDRPRGPAHRPVPDHLDEEHRQPRRRGRQHLVRGRALRRPDAAGARDVLPYRPSGAEAPPGRDRSAARHRAPGRSSARALGSRAPDPAQGDREGGGEGGRPRPAKRCRPGSPNAPPATNARRAPSGRCGAAERSRRRVRGVRRGPSVQPASRAQPAARRRRSPARRRPGANRRRGASRRSTRGR